jgi:hypothetical protein
METLIRLMASYIEIKEGEPNYLATIKFIDMLKQLISFDPKNTSKFDLVMAACYTLLCYEVYYESLFSYDDDMNSPHNIAAAMSALML